tara:strand:- start:498 stop:1427 length:930 start_codon:yes stop_codon:yes gene_type:complete
MKKFTDFRSEQIHINEIGPVGATIAAVTGLIGGAFALKKGLDKYKGYRESQKEKKANKKGFVVDLKVFNKDTGEIETVKKVVRDEKLDNDGVEKYRKKLQKDQDITNAGLEADFIDSGGPERVKREKEKADTDEPETSPQQEPQDDKDGEEEPKGAATAGDFVGKEIDKIPADMRDDVQNLERKKLKSTKDVEAHMKRWGIDRVVGFSKKKGPSGMPSDYEYVKNSRVISFGDYLKEDVVSDLKKISKSKKDMEIKLSDGSEIPLDPMTAEIFVKYIEGLKSSEQKRVINQIQRTERGFMKVLGKAHGE